MSLNLLWITISPSFYGLMYALGFWIGYYLIRREKKMFRDHIDDLFFYVFLGVILWGRLWYVIFYNLSYYISTPLEILAIWTGGMSFHGGVIGVIIAMYLFSLKKKISFLMIADEVTRVLPIGLFLGRIGNYINKELLWFPYTWPFAIKTENGSFFPSPLLEAFLEWVILFCILQYISMRKRFQGQVAAVFLIGYGVFRIFVEVFFRTPDAHIGYILPYTSIGTLLSCCMIIGWIIGYRITSKRS